MSRFVALLLLGGAVPLAAQGAAPRVYHLAPDSRLEVETGKAGLLGFAGHSHIIRATRFSGTVHYAAHDPAATTIAITILTDGLEVLTPPDTAEIRKVTASMRDDVLHVAQYPEISFTSTHVKPAGSGYKVTATLTMHGTTRELTVPVAVEFQGDTLVARGRFSVKQTDYGIRPFRGGPGGTVRVADEVKFRVEARALPE